MNAPLQVDYEVLYIMNVMMGSPFWDQFFLGVTQLHKNPYMQMYGFPLLILFGLYILGRQIWRPILALAITVSLSDLLCYRIVKMWVQRPRPFENPEIAEWLRKVGEAHGSSFPSNHAANVFAGASILSWYFPEARQFFYLFALVVAWSRPALGVHYPSDALAGAILGLSVAGIIKSGILNRARIFWLPQHGSKVDEDSRGWRRRIRR